MTKASPLSDQGHPARKYDNRITVIQADLNAIDLSPWLDEADNHSQPIMLPPESKYYCDDQVSTTSEAK